jgi:adenosylcobinamide-phosphate synthase
VSLVAGYLADLLVGDPERWHPVAGFGRLAAALERAAYAPTRTRGAAFCAVLVGGAAAVGELLARVTGRRPALALVTWAALGGRSLWRVAGEIAATDLERSCAMLPALVGRDTAELDEAGVARAVVESVAENTADAIVGPLFWGTVAGPAGVTAYRAANTLDAMVGHRNARYAEFGWASARLDDAMNWPVARIGAALTVVLGGAPRRTWRTLRRDGARHPSPNAGRMEAAFAGALGVRLGGELRYSGHAQTRPLLGDGEPPGRADVRRAVSLSMLVGAAAAVVAAGVAR